MKIKLSHEQKLINDYNHAKAALYFNLQDGWVLHHKNPDWQYNDVERYIKWNIDDLVPMSRGEHQKLHMELAKQIGDTKKYGHKLTEEEKNTLLYYAKLPKSEEHKKNISISNKRLFELGLRDLSGENNPMYGKHQTEETKKKSKETKIKNGTYGLKTKGSSGMHWYTNGKDNVLSIECPKGYKKGRTLLDLENDYKLLDNTEVND